VIELETDNYISKTNM